MNSIDQDSPRPFEPIEPFETGFLTLDAVHTMYWEQSGNPDGVPVLFLHGGPGAAFGLDQMRRQFDPDYYRLVIFHPRGAGHSTPLGELTDNTTQHLICDIEQLRMHLDIDRWVVAGGSWGSTLSLAYAESHPERCSGLLLRGIYLARDGDLDWFFTAARSIHPEIWERFIGFLPAEERHEFLPAYWRRILDPDPEICEAAYRAWSAYEMSMISLIPDPAAFEVSQDMSFAKSYARLNAHYLDNGCFLADRPILANIRRIQQIPGIIVHGRYDLSTPFKVALELSRAWPRAELMAVADGGHSGLDPAIAAAWLAAQERMKGLLDGGAA